jgi:hypothetical protein
LRFLRQLDGKHDAVADRLLDLTARDSSLKDQFVGFRGKLADACGDFVGLNTGWTGSTLACSASNPGSISSKSDHFPAFRGRLTPGAPNTCRGKKTVKNLGRICKLLEFRQFRRFSGCRCSVAELASRIRNAISTIG